ncbi:hypothetical protein GCM10020366_02490 [Saccharopolyspora gregorii]|uniref:Uncharacterized protein n=1 Tax=Saccharopolyspora gregorii TaxID=33914 RepID=A0ABP6RGD0_9PSEU
MHGELGDQQAVRLVRGVQVRVAEQLVRRVPHHEVLGADVRLHRLDLLRHVAVRAQPHEHVLARGRHPVGLAAASSSATTSATSAWSSPFRHVSCTGPTLPPNPAQHT